MAIQNSQDGLFLDAVDIPDNPLKDRRVTFIGKFKNRAALIRNTKEIYGASSKSNDNLTRDTQILVVGDDVKQEDIDRLACYEHDGWHPLQITYTQLQDIFAGNYHGFVTPSIAKKHISIDMSYYNWNPPIAKDVNDTTGTIRCKSPIVYSEQNPVYGLEIYVPDIPGINMNVFRQIIGNFGGYANSEYYDDTNVILLSDETLCKLKNGIKDNIIRNIEEKYNNGSSDIFNIQFTSESDLITWVKKRIEKFKDKSTENLLNQYFEDKQKMCK